MNLIVFVPLLYALIVLLIDKHLHRLHTGWFVLPIPVFLFLYLAKQIPFIAREGIFIHSIPWIPSLGINYTTYVDGLSLPLPWLQNADTH